MSFLRGAGKRLVKAVTKPPDPRPRFHGDDPDPRYPSSRELRRFFAPFIDVALHAGITLAAVHEVEKHVDRGLALGGLAILIFLAVSFVHTVILQRIFRATLGKIICGVVFIRKEDGSYPSFSDLLGWYFVRGIYAILMAITDGQPNGDESKDVGMPVVRRRDVKALRSSAGYPPAQLHPHQQHNTPPNPPPGYPPNSPMPHGQPPQRHPGAGPVPQQYPSRGYPPNPQPLYETPPPNPQYRQSPNPHAPNVPPQLYPPNRYPPG